MPIVERSTLLKLNRLAQRLRRIDDPREPLVASLLHAIAKSIEDNFVSDRRALSLGTKAKSFFLELPPGRYQLRVPNGTWVEVLLAEKPPR